jgi:hypothetical protein
MSVGTTNIVNVNVDDELGRRGVMKKQVVVKGALEVAEDALHSSEMKLTRVMHVEAHLPNCVEDVRLGEGEVLEIPNQVVVGSRDTDRGTHVRGDLGLSVD